MRRGGRSHRVAQPIHKREQQRIAPTGQGSAALDRFGAGEEGLDHEQRAIPPATSPPIYRINAKIGACPPRPHRCQQPRVKRRVEVHCEAHQADHAHVQDRQEHHHEAYQEQAKLIGPGDADRFIRRGCCQQFRFGHDGTRVGTPLVNQRVDSRLALRGCAHLWRGGRGRLPRRPLVWWHLRIGRGRHQDDLLASLTLPATAGQFVLHPIRCTAL